MHFSLFVMWQKNKKSLRFPTTILKRNNESTSTKINDFYGFYKQRVLRHYRIHLNSFLENYDVFEVLYCNWCLLSLFHKINIWPQHAIFLYLKNQAVSIFFSIGTTLHFLVQLLFLKYFIFLKEFKHNFFYRLLSWHCQHAVTIGYHQVLLCHNKYVILIVFLAKDFAWSYA